MLFAILVVLLGSLVSTTLRTLVLSRHANKFTSHTRWSYDTGARYAWLAFGPVFAIILVKKAAPVEDWILLWAWLVGVALVWWLPPHLAKKI